MNINFKNKNDYKKLDKLIQTRLININISDMLLSFFMINKDIPTAKNKEEYLSHLYDFWELDPNDEDNKEIIDQYIAKHLKELDDSDFKNNKYYKIIGNCGKNEGLFHYSLEKFYPYQGFSYDDIIINHQSFYEEIYQVGYFKNEVDYLALKHKKDTWMSITPNEINTNQQYIDKCEGNVLILGLGLGYFPFMLLDNEKVKSITIVELSKEVIKLFNDNIKKYFPKDYKLTIVQGDAFKYLKTNQKHYDSIFIDLWHDPNDGLMMYEKLKNIEIKYDKSTKFYYWLETSIIALLRRCVITLIEEQLNCLQDDAYLKSDNYFDRLINKIYFKTKKLSFDKYEKLHEFLSDESLIKLLID